MPEDFEETVAESVYVDLTGIESRLDGIVERLADQGEQLRHLSAQMDLLHGSVHVGNELALIGVVCLALIAACGMFAVGRWAVRRG